MKGVMTLTVHLVWCAVGRCRIARILLHVVIAVLLQLLNAACRSLVLTWYLRARLVADWRQLDRSSTLLITRSRGTLARVLTIGRNSCSSSALFVGLALVFFLLLTGLPLLSNFLEFCETIYVSVLMLHENIHGFGRPMLAPDLVRLSPVQVRPSFNAKENHPAYLTRNSEQSPSVENEHQNNKILLIRETKHDGLRNCKNFVALMERGHANSDR